MGAPRRHANGAATNSRMVSRATLGLERRAFVHFLSFGAAIYLAGLAAWATLYWLVRDATWWLFVVNAVAVYLFVPVPLVFVVAWFSRRKSLLLGGLLAVTVWVYLWGALFLPRPDGTLEGPSLTVMTFNTLV